MSIWLELRTTPASPTIFSSGDLVEALISLVVIPVGRQHALKLILRGLTMLDNTERRVSKFKVPSNISNKTYDQHATMKRNAGTIVSTPSPGRYRLKRKVYYDDKDRDSVQEEGALRGLSRLCVDKDVRMDKSQ
jgi:hypothetical protein